MSSHLSHALLALLDRRDRSATALAAEIGVHQTTVSRACAGERLSVESLKALCTKQPNPRDGLDLLLAHLRDEVERAGRHQTEVKISADVTTHEADIRLLETQARDDDELRAILHDLAQLVRAMHRKLAAQSYPTDHGQNLAAAEDSPPAPRARRRK